MATFPFYKQHDSMQCGIACLLMICKFYGKKYSYEYISKFCCATNEGVSLLAIKQAAKKVGLCAKGYRIDIRDLLKQSLPCLLHWNQNHFVILFKVSSNGKKFHIADPGKGLVTFSLEEFQRHWINTSDVGQKSGIAMFFSPTSTFYQMETPESDKRHSFKFLLQYLKQYQYYFILIIGGLLLGCVLQLILPFLTQSIVDVGIKEKNIGFIWLILLGQLIIIIGRTSMDFIRRWLLLHISMRINISLVSDFFIKLLKLPMSFFDTKQMGDLIQRMADHNRVQSFLTNQTLSVMFSILSFIVYGTVLFYYNKLIFTIFLVCSCLYGLWISSFLHKRKILDYKLFEQQAINQNKTFQFFRSMQEIKLQDCERRRRWEWEDVQADLFVIQMKSLKLQQAQEAGSIFINEMKNMIITVMAATSVINGQMTLGMMLAVQYIIGQLNSPIEQIMGFIYSLQDVKISLERINEIHLTQNEENNLNSVSAYKSNDKSIYINQVCFKYDPHTSKNILEDISFNIPGEKVTAIVGASGSGKSTLIKLLLGYYPTTKGAITIAGRDIEEYNLKWWRRHCGVVMQDGFIFSESIARNIAVDDDEIDIKRLEVSARVANIHDYIMSLPLKYNTLIGYDGIGLSQGQKQRILIARAVYKSPDYIFLDEATNALDAKNERIIVKNLNDFYKGKTVVIVAHRLSTVKNADQIIVLNDGKVVEIGNHTSLIAYKGIYYKLIKDQLELGS